MMADIYSSSDARKLLQNKYVLLIGDSNMRAAYKDLITLISRNELIQQEALRKKGEETFEGDQCLKFSGLIKGTQYVEHRNFVGHDCHIEFMFITRCYSPELENFLTSFKDNAQKAPDIIIMNSCVWDISRYGPNARKLYKDNMIRLMKLLKNCLTEKTLFIWTTAPPISSRTISNALLLKSLDFMRTYLRFEVIEANLYCSNLMEKYRFNVLDLHYYLLTQIHRRNADGIHYGPLPVRLVTNLILTHIALTLDVPLPGNEKNSALQHIVNDCIVDPRSRLDPKLPNVPELLDTVSSNNKKCTTANNQYLNIQNNDSRNNTQHKIQQPAPIRPLMRMSNNRQLSGFTIPWRNNSLPIWKNDDGPWNSSAGNYANDPRPSSSNEAHYRNDQGSAQYSYNENFGLGAYADFNRVPKPGPIRQNSRFQNRTQPY